MLNCELLEGILEQGILPTNELMPSVKEVTLQLKRWLIDTFRGGIQPVHLDYYLDEFAFRFNMRDYNEGGLLFHCLAEQCVETDPTPYKKLVDSRPR